MGDEKTKNMRTVRKRKRLSPRILQSLKRRKPQGIHEEMGNAQQAKERVVFYKPCEENISGEEGVTTTSVHLAGQTK